MAHPSNAVLTSALSHYPISGTLQSVTPIDQGNINHTYLAYYIDSHQKSFNIILQSVNTAVFADPVAVMNNILLISQHFKAQLPPDSPWKFLEIIPTVQGLPYLSTADHFWRAVVFIDDSITFNEIQNQQHAHEIGRALGFFHKTVSKLPTDCINNTAPFFHNTPYILSQHLSHPPKITVDRQDALVAYCEDSIHRYAPHVSQLEEAKQAGHLPVRIIHGDPKINNILFHKDKRHALCMIDMDTLMPGIAHYDLGDCLRSACNRLGEETLDFDAVSFDIDIAKTILSAYAEQMQGIFQLQEFDALFAAIWLIPFELGVRFYSDYLAGNVFFHHKSERHNLERAVVQFKLLDSIMRQEQSLKAIANTLKEASVYAN